MSQSPYDNVPGGVTFQVAGFTGLDVLREWFLSEKQHARSIARRWKRGPGHFIQMPSGRLYAVLDSKGNVAERIADYPGTSA